MVFTTYLNSKSQEKKFLHFELEFRRDDSVMRYLTVKLDKHAAAWAEKRRARVKSAKK